MVLLDHVNPDSLEIIEAIVEPSLRDAQKGSHWQFERTGYFVVDSGEGGLRFNRTVGLKDTWSKPETAPAPPEAQVKAAPKPADDDGKRKRKRKAKTEVHDALLAADPELARRLDRYQSELGLSEKDATTLTSDRALSDYFESAVSSGAYTRGIANWTINAVQGWVKEHGIDALKLTGPALAVLVDRLSRGPSHQRAQRRFEAIASSGGRWTTPSRYRCGTDH